MSSKEWWHLCLLRVFNENIEGTLIQIDYITDLKNLDLNFFDASVFIPPQGPPVVVLTGDHHPGHDPRAQSHPRRTGVDLRDTT